MFCSLSPCVGPAVARGWITTNTSGQARAADGGPQTFNRRVACHCERRRNANPAARNLGSYHGTREIAPFVSRTFEWRVVISCASPLCPSDLLRSPKIEEN